MVTDVYYRVVLVHGGDKCCLQWRLIPGNKLESSISAQVTGYRWLLISATGSLLVLQCQGNMKGDDSWCSTSGEPATIGGICNRLNDWLIASLSLTITILSNMLMNNNVSYNKTGNIPMNNRVWRSSILVDYKPLMTWININHCFPS